MRRIFSEFAGGDNARMISERLNEENIDCPRFYHAKYAGGQKPKPNENNNWGSTSIIQMLKNQVYIGNMAQGKRKVTSFKTKKRRSVDPENWIVVEGMHEPIIDRELWDRVQKRLNSKSHRVLRRKEDHQLSLFAGVLHCADCGSPLAYTTKERKDGPIGVYRCTRYVNNGKEACSMHYIPESTLITFVLNDIRLHAKLATAEKDRITHRLIASMKQSQGMETLALDKQMSEAQNRLAAIAANIKSLYEDKCLGKLPDNVFQKLLSDYITEQSDLEGKLNELRQQLNDRECTETEIGKWLRLISRYMEIKELDRQTVMELIESITISEANRESGKRAQEITIQYRFIGNLLENAKEDIA